MRQRLAIQAAALTSMIVLAFCIPLALVVRAVAADRAVHSGELEARSLAAVLTGTRDPEVVRRIIDQYNAGSPRPATVYLPMGEALGDQTPIGPEIEQARLGRSFSATVSSGRAVLVPVEGSAGSAVVRVLVPDAQLTSGVRRAWLLLGFLALAIVALAVVLADRLGRSLVLPMERLRTVAARLRDGDLTARADGQGPHEIAEVGLEVNRLADRIEGLLRAEREATADLSHRLRTPLTALRLDVDALQESTQRDRLVGEVDALEAAVDRLIRAARQARPPASAAVDLATATKERMVFWSVLAEHQGRAVAVDVPEEPHLVAVTNEDLDAAIDALVGNVFAHTPDGTPFWVAVVADGVTVTLRVSDEGAGFEAPGLVGRGESGGGSTGLGLDIVRRTAEATGGRLVVCTAPTGGACVEAVFPIAPVQSS
jgi:signal transduction histidine kinase